MTANEALDLDALTSVTGRLVFISEGAFEDFNRAREDDLRRAKLVGDFSVLATELQGYPEPLTRRDFGEHPTRDLLKKVVDRYDRWQAKDGVYLPDYPSIGGLHIEFPHRQVLSRAVGVDLVALSTDSPQAVIVGRVESSVSRIERRFGAVINCDEREQRPTIYYSNRYEVEDFRLDDTLVELIRSPS